MNTFLDAIRPNNLSLVADLFGAVYIMTLTFMISMNRQKLTPIPVGLLTSVLWVVVINFLFNVVTQGMLIKATFTAMVIAFGCIMASFTFITVFRQPKSDHKTNAAE